MNNGIVELLLSLLILVTIILNKLVLLIQVVDLKKKTP